MEKGKIILDYGTQSRSSRTQRWIQRIELILLIAIVLVLLAFGWFYWGWSIEQSTIKQFENGLGSVYTEKLDFPMRGLIPKQYQWVLERSVAVDLFDKCQDNDLILLQRLPRLQILHTSYSSITEKGLIHIAQIKQLKELYFSWVRPVNEDGLRYLRNMKNLQVLDINSSTLTNKGVEYLKELSGLQTLNISDTKITDQDLMQLIQLPKLKALNISHTAVTHKGVEQFRKAKPDCQIKY